MDHVGDDLSPVVVVTGATGFIGRAVLHALDGGSWIVHPIVRRQTGLPSELIVDFGQLGWVQVLDALPRVDAVIHLAGRVSFGLDRSDLLVLNALTTGHLAHWAQRRGAYVMYASTIAVYGTRAVGVDSSRPLCPDTPYALTKWLGEEFLRLSEADHSILRIGGVFGLDGPEHLGLNRAIAGVLRGVRPVLSGEGDGWRNYIYVHDLAEVVVRCLTQRLRGIHLVAGQSTHTMKEMLQILCDAFLPGRTPELRPGLVLRDQVIQPSPVLHARRSFREAVEEMRRETQAASAVDPGSW